MRRSLTPAPLLLLALLSLPACGENEEYSDRAEEIETDPPAVAPTMLDSAVEGAAIATSVPLGGGTTVRTDSAGAG